MDLIRNLFPPNLIGACTSQMSTVLIYPGNDNMNKTDWEFKTVMGGNMNILGKFLQIIWPWKYYTTIT